jgi:hypothetical protein
MINAQGQTPTQFASEAPAFQLFQKVRVLNPKEHHCPQEGIVSGMEYVDPRFADRERVEPGWYFSVNFLMAIPEKKSLKAREARITYVTARELEPIAG